MFSRIKIFRRKVELNVFNYATKVDLKNVAGVDISKFANRADLANFKYYLVRQDIDKLKNVSYLSNLGSKVDTCTY